MPRTFFQDFKRDDGTPVTVEYSFSPGSETTYSPAYGADSGDPYEVEIVSVMPAIKLTDAEDARFCDYIAEHHVHDDDDPDIY